MFDKHALKHKMGKVINIKISVDKDDEEKKTDNAPIVEDSDEPGVVKATPSEQMSHKEPQADDFASALIAHAPPHPGSGKTLDSIARERAIKRMDAKKGLKG